MIYKDREPCTHKGCELHITHPCEVCGRTGARGAANLNAFPLRYTLKNVDPSTLTLGANYDHVGYAWRPYAERPADHRADYDRLAASLFQSREMVNPLIVFRGAVLIGMRRCEIAVDQGWDIVPIWDIQDDITHDSNANRVLCLRDTAYQEVKY